MNFLEVLRVCLFVVEWIWTACAAFLFPDKLVGKNSAVQPDGNVCYFDRQIDLSRCNFGFAWGLIAFLVLSATLVWYLIGFCSSFQLPANVEVIIFSWLSLWWLLGAVVLTAVKSGQAKSQATTVVVFAWMLFIFTAISAFLASRPPDDFSGFPVEEDDSLGKTDYETNMV